MSFMLIAYSALKVSDELHVDCCALKVSDELHVHCVR